MSEEKYDEGWVEHSNDWTLYDAATEIDNEAYVRACLQFEFEVHKTQDRFNELDHYFKREMWGLAQRLLAAEYKIIDMEQFSYHLQHFAIDFNDDAESPDDDLPIPEIVDEGEDEGLREESIPTPDELNDWLSE